MERIMAANWTRHARLASQPWFDFADSAEHPARMSTQLSSPRGGLAAWRAWVILLDPDPCDLKRG
jgi:hypothetical protein